MLRGGEIETLRGVDALTGLPALLYLLPEQWIVPPLDHPNLLPYSDGGDGGGGGGGGDRPYLACALPPASAPASDPRTAALGALSALAWLHRRGQLHGGLTPEQLWQVGGEVRVAGAGLPWGELGGGYDAPEGGKTPAADLYALGKSLQTLGPLPAALECLLGADPAARGGAEDALARLRAPAGPVRGVHPTEGVLVVPGEAEQTEQPAQTGSAPGVVVPSVVVIEAAPAPGPLLDDVFGPAPDAPSLGQASADSTPAAPTPPLPAGPTSPRAGAVRIGWEEDHSWRVVKSAPAPARPALPMSRLSRPAWLWLALGTLLALVVIGWMVYASRPRPPQRVAGAACCAVNFELRGTADVGAQLHVVGAPVGSGLKGGERLGRIPGRVTFPNAPGRYTLRATAAGYEPQNLTIQVPSARPVVIELGR